LAFHLERDESPDPVDVVASIDKVGEFERKIGQRRQHTFRAIVAASVFIGIAVMLLTNPLFGICAAVVTYLLLDNYVLRKLPSFVGVELLLRDAAHRLLGDNSANKRFVDSRTKCHPSRSWLSFFPRRALSSSSWVYFS
jgi:hypothetical protein